MSNFAVLHATKFKGGSGGIGSHIDRTQKNLPKYIDTSRTHLNKDYVPTGGTLKSDIERRIKEGYRATNKDGTPRNIRKDAVKSIGVILSGSNEQMKRIQDKGYLDAWAKANLKFAQDKFGAENIVRFTLHMDETTPHIHCVFVPLDKEGRLNQKEFIGGKDKLSKLQDQHGELMAAYGFKRGERHSKMKHTTTREYYRELNVTVQEAGIKTNMVGYPQKGEDERLRDLFTQMAKAIIEARRLLEKEQNLKEEWEQKLKKEETLIRKERHQSSKALEESKRLEANQKAIIKHNIEKFVNEEKAKLQGLYDNAKQELLAKQKEKESVLVDLLKTKHINDTLKSINNYMQKNQGIKKEFVYNEKKDSLFIQDINKRKDQNRGMGMSR